MFCDEGDLSKVIGASDSMNAFINVLLQTVYKTYRNSQPPRSPWLERVL